MTKEPAETQVISDVLSEVFCECRSTMQADIGKLSGELFQRVDNEGLSIEVAAEALGLGTREARTLLFMFRRRMVLSLARGAGSSEAANTRRL